VRDGGEQRGRGGVGLEQRRGEQNRTEGEERAGEGRRGQRRRGQKRGTGGGWK